MSAWVLKDAKTGEMWQKNGKWGSDPILFKSEMHADYWAGIVEQLCHDRDVRMEEVE